MADPVAEGRAAQDAVLTVAAAQEPGRIACLQSIRSGGAYPRVGDPGGQAEVGAEVGLARDARFAAEQAGAGGSGWRHRVAILERVGPVEDPHGCVDSQPPGAAGVDIGTAEGGQPGRVVVSWLGEGERVERRPDGG